MENKKTFGAYILQRRKELGMTQREFASQLYVTESAVSKWERGLSYPDITLLQNICSVLDISEYELLNGSEDTKRRSSEKLAVKYLRLTRNYRISQYIIYGLILLGCAIGNLASSHTLDWFFIVLAAVMMAASLTLIPALTALCPKLEHYKAPISIGAFTVSFELLLFICCLYSGGDWFIVAGPSVLFGLSFILLPFLLPALPLPAYAAGRKASFYLLTEIILLLFLLLMCSLYSGGNWFMIAAVSVVFGLGFFILPVLLCQLLKGKPLYQHKALLYFSIQTVLLIVLLVVADSYTGANVLLGVSLPIAFLCLLLPWGVMAAIRYLTANPWLRASAAFIWSDLWIWISPYAFEKIVSARYGASSSPYTLMIPFDFSVWAGQKIAYNVLALILFSFTAAAVILAVIGIMSNASKRKNKE